MRQPPPLQTDFTCPQDTQPPGALRLRHFARAKWNSRSVRQLLSQLHTPFHRRSGVLETGSRCLPEVLVNRRGIVSLEYPVEATLSYLLVRPHVFCRAASTAPARKSML